MEKGSIGIFDSGIGGLTFVREARARLPDESFIYFADTDHVPYGTREKEEVKRFIAGAIDFLALKGIKLLVLACNTATSIAVKELRDRHAFPVIGMEPAVKPALNAVDGKRVLLLSTSLTIREEKLQALLREVDRHGRVDPMPFDELVGRAEAFDFDSPAVRRLIREKLAAAGIARHGAIVLGCTHFIFYRDLIRRMVPATVRIFDGNRGTLNHLLRTLDRAGLRAGGPGGEIAFYSSGRADGPARVRRLLELIG